MSYLVKVRIMANSVLSPPQSTAAVEMRDFGDSRATRQKIFSNVLKAAQTIEPIANVRHRLALDDVHYSDNKEYSLKEQKQAILKGQSLHHRLRGTWRLYDAANNQLIDEQQSTLAQVPYMTERGTFILNGNEYSLSSQMRLRPGIFTRIKENGEIESHVNVMPGKGLSHRYFLDPVTGVFKINIGQSKVPLLPVLRALGTTDKELREHWGNDLYHTNLQKDDPLIVDKIYSKLVRRGTAQNLEEKSKALAETLHKMELDPEVTKRTLGKPFDKLTKEAILLTTRKLLAVSKGHEEPDDRDHLAFQTFMGPEDLIAERIGKDKGIMRQVLWRSFIKNNLAHVQPNTFSKSILGAIMSSGLGQPLEEVNNSDIFDQQGRVTRLGVGGIPCYSGDMEVLTINSWKQWKDVTEDDCLAVLTEGHLNFAKPIKLYSVNYKGLMYGAKGKICYSVTPDHRMYVFDGDDWGFEYANRIHKVPRTFWCGVDNNDEHLVKTDDYYVNKYEGEIYCAAVPGGLVFVKSGDGVGFWCGNSIDAVPDEARNVQPSHFSFIDPIRTPECGSADTEVFTSTGWKLWPEVTKETKLACLIDDQLKFECPTHLYAEDYEGPMYGAKTSNMDYLVTPNHRMYVKPYDDVVLPWRFELAEYMHGRRRKLLCGGHKAYIVNAAIKTFDVPSIPILSNNTNKLLPIDIDVWAEFMGWYLSEGCVSKSVSKYATIISQTQRIHPENCDRIASLLNKMPIKYHRTPRQFVISGKQLAAYCHQFGYCYDKWIPEYLLEATISARVRLFEALLLGDGRRNKKGQLNQYCTSSHQLALDFQRLAFSLGYSTAISVEPENRQEHYRDCYIVNIHERNERTLIKKDYYIEQYAGKVYCATVPGGMLFVKRGNGFGHWTGNSFKVGIDSRVSYAAKKGADGRLYAPFVDIKTGKTVYKTPQDVADLAVAFPNELNKNKPVVAVMSKGQTKFVPREQVQLEMPAMENAFSPLANMIPGKSGVKGQRVAMGSRFLTQALAVKDAESPHVQSAMPDGSGRSFEEYYGKHMGAVFADQGGKVIAKDEDSLTVEHPNGTRQVYDLYNEMPYNRKSFIHNTAMVNVGDTVQPNQLLAKSNFTDNTGATALGKNARVAYIPFRGLNYEDAFVISDGFAKRMTSEHMYQHDHEWLPSMRQGKKTYISLFPTKYDKHIMEKLDDDGIIKQGQTVNFNDPLVLVPQEKEASFSQIHRGRGVSYSDKSILWEHHSPGVITDVAKTKKGVTVAVKAYSPMQVGDKLSGLYGDKGVISSIVPDDEMPHGEDKKPYEVLLNPLGVISRSNSTQMVTAALGKIAEATGKKYKLEDFKDIEDLTEYAINELQKHGMKDLDTITDPKTGTQIPNVFTGNRFMMKLHHTAECYDDQTEVLTGRGWLLFNDVTMQDKLATVDNGKLIFEEPLELIKEQYAGTIYCFSNDELNYAVTPNHRMYVKTFDLDTLYYDSDYTFKPITEIHGLHFHVPQLVLGDDRFVHPSTQYGRFFTRDYSGMVYCANMRTGLLYVRRNGKPMLCGNSKGQGRGIGSYTSENTPAKGGPEGCFVPKQLIQTIDGPMHIATICEKRLATQAWTFSDKLNEWVYRPITDWFIRKSPISEIKTICTADGRTLSATNNHNVFLYDGTKTTVDKLKVGDDLITWGMVKNSLEKIPLRIKSIKPYKHDKPNINEINVYDFTVDDTHCYCAGHSLVLNSKRISLMDLNALLSSGATEVIRDAGLVRGQRNDQYWQMFMSGFRPPEPQVPYVYRKFIAELKGSGINPVRKGGQLHIMALTNKDVKELTGNRYLQNAETVDWKEGLRPIKGGLFDPSLTGGHGSENLWAGIKLTEPMPSPVFEDPIRRLLGLTQKQYEDVLSGRQGLGKNGKLYEPTKMDNIFGHGSGPEAIRTALKSINLDRAIEEAQAMIHGSKKTARDIGIRRLKILTDSKRLKIHPADWFLDTVPVLPPTFRPVSVLAGTKAQMVADPNYLYKELFDANQSLEQLKPQVEDVSEERLAVYNAFKGVIGLGDPIHPKNQERQVKGILKSIFGTSPKLGMVQHKLLGSTVDLVGRAVIAPNPDFDMDHCGLPETRAWAVYTPFVIRRLVRRGMPRLQAARAVKDKDKLARAALLEEMADRPVIINRAPVLHRYGIMASWPILTKSDVLQISPIVTKGFGADFDGDAMQYHVPATDEAKDEAIVKMLPSRNLLSVSSFKAHMLPSQEYIGGLYAASTKVKHEKTPRVFDNKQSALAALRRGDIRYDDPIEILQH